jgi:hypothetical protein
MPKHIYLRKANDQLVSHCHCAAGAALIAEPGQMDCPWCGCGWLFVCVCCRRAFTFAEGIEINESWEATGQRAVRGFFGREPEGREVEEWIEFMQILLKDVERGEQYVYLDGYVIPVNAEGVSIEGWHSHHELDFVPQVAALSDQKVYDRLLCSEGYWRSNKVVSNDDE